MGELEINALHALSTILSSAQPSEFPSVAELEPVVNVIGRLLHMKLSEDMLDFRGLDSILGVAMAIAGGSAELARLVGTMAPEGIAYGMIPTSLLLILSHHTHEQRAGRTSGFSPLGDGMVHTVPILTSLEALYVISLNVDLRPVRIAGSLNGNEDTFVDVLTEYGDFLHGYVHHQINHPIAQGALARLRQFTSSSTPPMDPHPRPFESTIEQTRRHVQYFHTLLQSRSRVREQRQEQRTQGVGPAIERADAARQRGNTQIRDGNAAAAADAYTEAVAALTGLEMDASAAWPLVLALSYRAEAYLRMRHYEEVHEDCTNAWVLIEQHEGAFDAAQVASIGEKLTRRESAATQGVRQTMEVRAATEELRRAEEAQHQIRQAHAAERRQARADRRRRAREARAARRAREQAEAASDAQALAEVVAATAAAQLDEQECHICMEGRSEGPLDDLCGHGHLMHPGCAAIWRNRCLEQQRAAPAADRPGPHCPACRRPI